MFHKMFIQYLIPLHFILKLISIALALLCIYIQFTRGESLSDKDIVAGHLVENITPARLPCSASFSKPNFQNRYTYLLDKSRQKEYIYSYSGITHFPCLD